MSYLKEIRAYGKDIPKWKTDVEGKREWDGINTEGKVAFILNYAWTTCQLSAHFSVSGKLGEP